MPETVRLHVLGLLGDCLRDVFGHLGGLVRIAWPYYALAFLCGTAGLALGGESGWAGAAAGLLGPSTAGILVGLALLASTVKWQRHVVLAEPLRGIAPLNLRVLRYLFWSIAIGLLCALPLLAALVLAYSTDLVDRPAAQTPPYRLEPIGFVAGGLGSLAGIFLYLRLSIVLPSIAVDDRSMGFRRSWRLMRGHTLRLFAALLLLGLGLALLAASVGLVQAALEMAAEGRGVIPALTGLMLEAGVNLVASVAGASLLASAYLTLAGREVPGTAAPR
jgi:hypothetical protein